MKFCPACGTQLEDTARFCRECGAAVPAVAAPAPVQEEPTAPAQEAPVSEQPVAPAQEAPAAAPSEVPAQQPAAPAPAAAPVSKKQSKAGIVSFVLAFFFQGPAFVVGLVDVIRHNKNQKHSLAIAGMILSAVIMVSTFFSWKNITKSVITTVADSENWQSFLEDSDSFIQGLEDYLAENGIYLD